MFVPPLTCVNQLLPISSELRDAFQKRNSSKEALSLPWPARVVVAPGAGAISAPMRAPMAPEVLVFDGNVPIFVVVLVSVSSRAPVTYNFVINPLPEFCIVMA